MKKIVMKVPMMTDDQRKAVKIAVSVPGTMSVAVEGNDKDQLVVVGDVDVVELTRLLRKKMGHTELISVGPARENIGKKDEEGGEEKKYKGGGGEGGGGSEKKDKLDDSEKKDKEGGGRAGEKNGKANGELRKMGANKVYGGWFMYGLGTCAEAVLDEPKQEEWLLTVSH